MKEQGLNGKVFHRKKMVFIIGIGIIVIAGLFSIIFLLRRGPEDTAKDSLGKVLREVLVFPDETADTFYSMQKGEIFTEEYIGSLSDIGIAVREVITPYFTEKGTDSFLAQWYNYGSFCAATDWKAEVKEMEITVDSKEHRRLLFEITLVCISETTGDEKELLISGKAQYDTEGKLNYCRLSDESVMLLRKTDEEFNME